LSGLTRGFAAFFGRHPIRASFAALQPTAPTKRHRSRILPLVRVGFGRFAGREIDNPLSQLVRVRGTLAGALRHTPRVARRAANANIQTDPAPVTVCLVRALLPLVRAAGTLSRAAGRGGGTTLPGKLLWKLDPAAIDQLASQLPQGSVAVSATNGKTTSTAMVAEILRPRVRVAHNDSGANLVSGVASALLAARDAQLGLFEVDEGALPEVTRRVRPKALLLGNLFRDQLDRYGELELVAARWRDAVAALPHAQLVVNGDDPQVGALARPGGRVFGVDDPSVARPALQHAADSKYCLRCGTAYDYAAAYVGHLGDYRCPNCGHARPPLDVTARDIELRGLDGAAFALAAPEGETRIELRLPGLYNVYNALGAASLALALGSSLDDVREGLARFSAAFGRFERIAIGGRRVLMLLTKNPAGANEAIRTLVEGAAPSVAVIALNDAIADGRDVSWIWDVDFEPLLAGLDRLVATGSRAAELALRFAYGGLDRDRIEVVPSLDAALDRGLELTAEDGELTILPTYTAMLALRRTLAERGHVTNYWERAA
jgi:UDP-N-acetylmuramyl tripeptide synthase